MNPSTAGCSGSPRHPEAELERRLPRSSPTACLGRILPTAPFPSPMNPGERGAPQQTPLR